jgi:hypothetical protein
MSTTGAPVAAIDPSLAAARKVGLAAAPPRKANIGGAIANALMKHNANSAGVGFLLPKDPDTEVYVDRTGKIFVGDQPYDAKNPVHQQAAGIITIAGKPYDPNNPQDRASYLAFKNTAGGGVNSEIKLGPDGKPTIGGQPFDPANPAHVAAWQQRTLASQVAQRRVAQQPPQQQPPQQQTPRPAQPQAPAAAGSPEVTQALAKMGYTPQQAAALAAKVPQGTSTADAVKQVLQGKIAESLTWSRNFDPGRTLLKKIKSR